METDENNENSEGVEKVQGENKFKKGAYSLDKLISRIFSESKKHIFISSGIVSFSSLSILLRFHEFAPFEVVSDNHSLNFTNLLWFFGFLWVFIFLLYSAFIWGYKIKRGEEKGKEKKDKMPLYKYLNTTKHVTIFSDRHGVVQRTAEIEILDKENFSAIHYWFELDKSTIKELKFEGDLKQMHGDGIIAGTECRRKRFFGQTFVGKLFSTDNKEVLDSQRQLKIIPIEQQKNKKSFNIKFSKLTIDGNSVLKFGWAWTSYNLYPVTKKDKEEKCAEKLDSVESSIVIDTETDFLEFIISFEDGIKIDEHSVPTLHKQPQGGNEKEVGILKKENDMYYVRYKRGIPKPQIGDKYTVRWDYI